MKELKPKLRKETSIHKSGKLKYESFIPLLKDEHYIVKNINLDGDAPKQFIKAYFHEEDGFIRKSRPDTWNEYIAKTAEKWYPHESVIEFMMNRIGQVMGLRMNEIRLVRANNQIRFLSKYFINRKSEKLIHGAEICGEHLGDMIFAKEIADDKTSARTLFTFEFMIDAIRMVFPTSFESILCDLVKLLTFDALVGNNDRHFFNWGVIDTKKKTSKLPTFAPIYDSARGLLWNYSDKSLKKLLKLQKQGNNRVQQYIQSAYPRISIEANTEANHFELIEFIRLYNKDYNLIVNELACEENEINVLRMLEEDFYPFFIPERAELITLILQSRFKKIRGISYDANNKKLV